jgi:hypothetical protein
MYTHLDTRARPVDVAAHRVLVNLTIVAPDAVATVENGLQNVVTIAWSLVTEADVEFDGKRHISHFSGPPMAHALPDRIGLYSYFVSACFLGRIEVPASTLTSALFRPRWTLHNKKELGARRAHAARSLPSEESTSSRVCGCEGLPFVFSAASTAISARNAETAT